MDDRAAVEDDRLVGEAQDLRRLLLDDDHRQPFGGEALRAPPAARRRSIGARPSVGSSSSSSVGFSISARPIASICCSPPESWPPMLRAPLLEAREHRVDARESPRARRARRRSGSPRPSASGRCCAPAGTQPSPARARRCGGRRVSVDAGERDARRCALAAPISALISVVLPTPLRPSTASDRPVVEREVERLDDDRLAIAGAQGLRRAAVQPCASSPR